MKRLIGSAISPVSRRELLQRAGLASAVAAAGLGGTSALAREADDSEEPTEPGRSGGRIRRERAFRLRVKAAIEERAVPIPQHANNRDEALYPNRIGNHTKDLPHDSIGEVDPTEYGKLLDAMGSGDPADFDAVRLGGTVKLANPQGGLAFTMQGCDSAQLSIPPSPALASAERAAEMVEDYWMALLRDVPFSQYGKEPISTAAIGELNRLSGFTGPKVGGQVTPESLFRGSAPGDLIGPFISQFLLLPVRFGAINVTQKYNTYAPNLDYLTDFPSWLACQNGHGPFAANVIAGASYIKNGRDLSAYDHVDYLGQSTVTALLWMLRNGTPFNPANPYLHSLNQNNGPSFGQQHVFALLYEASIRASRAVFFQKWQVHRTLRPEAFGGLVHNTLAGVMAYPLHRDVLDSEAVSRVFSKYGSYLLPLNDPEGCPQHPAYAAQHAATQGAQVTALKAFFDESAVMPGPVIPSDDGQSLVPYTGSDATKMTLGGELNKLASNVSVGRDIEGVHWRSDAWQGLLLGEAAAISVLRDQSRMYNEPFSGFTFTSFEGNPITV
jgi:hypothetical protein